MKGSGVNNILGFQLTNGTEYDTQIDAYLIQNNLWETETSLYFILQAIEHDFKILELGSDF